MPQHQSAQKRARQAANRRIRNRHYISVMKSAIRKVRTATDKSVAETALKNAVTLLDKLAGKRIIHPNKASNQKSRLTRLVSKLP